MTTEVSPCCHASLRVVTVRVTLQELSPNPAAKAVNAAISTEITSFRISFLVIIVNLSFVHSLLSDFVAFGIIIGVELMHRITEKRTDLGLGFVLCL